jgi:hypothetical protein
MASGRLIVMEATWLRFLTVMPVYSVAKKFFQRCRVEKGGLGERAWAVSTPWSASHGETTRDTQHLTCNKRGLVTGEKQHGTSEVIGLTNTPDRDRAAKRFPQFFRVRCCVDETSEKSGVSWPRAHDVKRDAVT